MHLLLTCLFSLLSFKLAAFGLEPDFLYPLENLTIAQGRDAMFTCVVNNLGGYRVAWIKADTKAILAIHEHVITNNQRLSVTHNDDNTWTLNMRGVRREDRGTYMCQVNTDPMKSQSAYLEVVIPPDIIYEETSGDMMIPEGGSAKLICKARGFPPPRITWRREDGGEIIFRKPLLGNKEKVTSVDGDTLTLSKVTRSEMGVYMCIASNGVPPTVSKRLMLHVHFHPLIQVPTQLVATRSGSDVTLQCFVEASPKAINYWTRQSGEMIVQSPKYSMTETAGPYYTAVMNLTVKNIQESDLGGYKCVSKNSIGDAEGNIRLYSLGEKESSRKRLNDLEYEDNDIGANDDKNGNQGPLRESTGESQNDNSINGVSSINSLYILLTVAIHLTASLSYGLINSQ